MEVGGATMAYKDTLTLFEELVATGVPEAQAKIQAHQLGGVTDEFGKIRNVLERIEKDLFWMRIIGGAMTFAFLSAWFK